MSFASLVTKSIESIAMDLSEYTTEVMDRTGSFLSASNIFDSDFTLFPTFPSGSTYTHSSHGLRGLTQGQKKPSGSVIEALKEQKVQKEKEKVNLSDISVQASETDVPRLGACPSSAQLGQGLGALNSELLKFCRTIVEIKNDVKRSKENVKQTMAI